MTAAGQGADIVLTALGPAPLSRLAAGALGLPSLGTYLAPAVPTGQMIPYQLFLLLAVCDDWCRSSYLVDDCRQGGGFSR